MSDVAISDSIGRFLRANALATLDLLHLRMRLAAERQVQVSNSPDAHLPRAQVPGSAGVTE